MNNKILCYCSTSKETEVNGTTSEYIPQYKSRTGQKVAIIKWQTTIQSE